MNCPQCGNPNPEDGRFCTSCGATLAAPATEAPAPQPAAQPTYAPPPAAVQGYAYAPAPQPPAYVPPAAPVATAPPKKKRGCLIAVVVLGILLLCCCGSLAAGAVAVSRLGKPQDLGVRYSQKDYDSATKKLGIDVSMAAPDSPTAKGGDVDVAGDGVTEDTGGAGGGTAGGTSGGAAGGTSGGTAGATAGGVSAQGQAEPVASGPAAGTVVIYEGSVPVDIEMTNEEFSALVSLNHYSQNWLVKDMQVKFGDGNSVEMSGYVEWEGQRYPVYVAGVFELTGPRSVGGVATAVNVAGYEVPGEYYPLAVEFLSGLMNDWLAQMSGLNLESVEVADGMVHIKGSVPARVVRVPAGR